MARSNRLNKVHKCLIHAVSANGSDFEDTDSNSSNFDRISVVVAQKQPRKQACRAGTGEVSICGVVTSGRVSSREAPETAHG